VGRGKSRMERGRSRMGRGRCQCEECVCSSAHLDLHGGGCQGGDLLLHAVSDTRVHGGTTGQNVVGVQVLADVDVALHDAVVGGLVDAGGLHACRGRQRSVEATSMTRTAAHVIKIHFTSCIFY